MHTELEMLEGHLDDNLRRWVCLVCLEPGRGQGSLHRCPVSSRGTYWGAYLWPNQNKEPPMAGLTTEQPQDVFWEEL